MSEALSPEDRQRLETLFERAADLPPTEHGAFVERECGPNRALRAQLERMLAGLAGTDALGHLQPGAPLQAGTRIGPYKLLEKIGEGGMGEVYAADQKEPVQRRVALKIIKPGMDSAQVVARFEAERQALARMSHANVAQVFDGGTTTDGRPYFVMELVAGDPIAEYCDLHKLSTRERIELFLAICDGVQHAHQKGIIHRDLKPSNLLVMRQDGRAIPKIIDFGVARATTGRLAERTLFTMLGQVVGTLDYMSPEQADPTALDIDTRSDIYSLGVVLYQLVSGLLPFDHASAVNVPFSEIQRVIRDTDPPAPSARLAQEKATAATLAPLHGADERSLRRALTGDVDWICLKALEKNPSRRYQSASELAADLRRHLSHEPVLAGRPSMLYRGRKFVRRNRVVVAASALVAGTVSAAIVGIVAARLEVSASDRLARAAMDAERVVGLAVEADDLWPPYPEKIEDLKYWLTRAREIVDRTPRYREMLDELRGAGGERRQIEAISNAIEGAERLESGLLAKDAITAEHGMSVKKRLDFAASVEDRTVSGAEAKRRWSDAIEAVGSSPKYGGLELTPQLGLLPIGEDPQSHLWEFAHVLTGVPPERGEDGALLRIEGMSVVLVLIPGGTFEMGLEPSREVELPPYFLSKYEMTQGQWQRVVGRNPSAYGKHEDADWKQTWSEAGHTGSLLHPVEQVTWLECNEWLSRLGLSLPSEAQWERGARAGTESRFWTGDDRDSLQGVANIRDGSFVGEIEDWTWVEEGFNDGSEVHWEVGRGAPNKFGLHDVHGNVAEWCLTSVGEGSADLRNFICGGNFRSSAARAAARVAKRRFESSSFSGSGLGVRPARGITAPE